MATVAVASLPPTDRACEADALIERHHRFANSVAFIQVSIALAAVAALRRNSAVWIGSILLGLIGASLFTLTLVK
jgi:hypothetical protein